MKRVLIWSSWILPAPFRGEFGREIIDQLERDYDIARTRGVFAAARFTARAIGDLIGTSVAERWHPTATAHAINDPESEGVQHMLSEWTGDLRHAVRALRRSPGFAVVAIATLGLAIGVNAGMFSVVDAVLLRSLPYPQPDRLVYVAASAPGTEMPAEFGVSREFYLQYRERSHLLQDVALFNSFTNSLRVGDRVERVRMSWPTYTLFSTLGVKPILGRLPVADDESRVFVISYATWQSWFGGDRSVIGRSYEVAGSVRTIIGVMGPDFQFPVDGTTLWISSAPGLAGLDPGHFGEGMVARMKPGVTTAALTNELNTLAQGLPQRFGGSANYARTIARHRAVVRTLRDQLVGGIETPLLVLFAAVGIVLLIACANVANLFTVRAEGRLRELAVRRAIGARRGQLIRMQMAEAVVIAIAAGAVAAILAKISLPLFVRAAPADVPRLGDAGLGAAVIGFVVAVTFVTAIACGLIPAIRGSAPDLRRLRQGGRGSTHQRPWVRDGLVVAQTALALVLLIGSGLLLRSFERLRRVNPGYDIHDIFTFQIAPDRPSLKDGPTFARFDLAFMDRMRALPGVQSVGLIENVPLDENTDETRFRSDRSADASAELHFNFTAGDYFKTMKIKVLSGRSFTDDESLAWRGNAVVSRAAAAALWPGINPLGRRLQMGGDTTWFTVIGVVDDVMQDDFRQRPNPVVYFPIVGPTDTSWAESSPGYVIRTTRAEKIAPEVRAIVHDIAPEAPMYRIYTMAGLAQRSMVDLSFTMLTLAIAATLALILGIVGLYGVLSYVVAQRTREIGVRMALGADAAQVRRMVVAQGARVVGAGIVLGLVGAALSTQALRSLLFGVTAIDVTTFAAMSALLIGVGIVASYLPARRASAVDPIESLRGE
jgi:predicted permease